jgi:hypothetical protein
VRPFLCAAVLVAAGVVAGFAAPGGSARSATPGDGCLVMSQGFGKLTVTLTRGVIFGRFESGYVVYNDQGADPILPRVPGVIPTKTTDHTWKYGPASPVRFRATGPTKLIVNAQALDLSVAGKGVASITAAGWDGVPSTLNPPSNAFSVDSDSFCEDNFQHLPTTLTRFQIASPVSG